MKLELPPEPGILFKTRRKQLIEIKIEPDTHPDRGLFLQVCKFCHAPILRGSLFCPNCSKALTLEAIAKHELREKTLSHANACFKFALLGTVPGLLFCLIILLPVINSFAATSQSGPEVATVVAQIFKSLNTDISVFQNIRQITTYFVLMVIPMFSLGRRAIFEGQVASHYLNIGFGFEKGGQKRIAFGQALGWFNVYLAIALVAIILIPRIIQ